MMGADVYFSFWISVPNSFVCNSNLRGAIKAMYFVVTAPFLCTWRNDVFHRQGRMTMTIESQNPTSPVLWAVAALLCVACASVPGGGGFLSKSGGDLNTGSPASIQKLSYGSLIY